MSTTVGAGHAITLLTDAMGTADDEPGFSYHEPSIDGSGVVVLSVAAVAKVLAWAAANPREAVELADTICPGSERWT